MSNAIKGLENFLTKTQLNSTDNEVTLGEAQEFIRGTFDTNGDGRIDNLDRFDTNGNGVIDPSDDPARTQILREMAYVDLRGVPDLDPVLRAKLIQAQDALKLSLKQNSPIVPPPPINSSNPLFNDELIRDPYDLADDTEDKRWSDMRKGFEGKTITINRDEAKRVVTNIIDLVKSGNPTATIKDQTDAVVFNLWRNEDYVGGERRQVFRVEEMKGVLDHINSLPPDQREEFKNAFKKSMAEYASNSKNNLDQQFVMDSMMQILGSTDFAGDSQSRELKIFVKEVAIGLAENSDFFKNKIPACALDRVVLGNYDGTKDMGIFSSMALVRNADRTYTFIEHQVAPPTNKTRYIFEGGTPPGGFAPGGLLPALPPPSSGTTTPPSTRTRPPAARPPADETPTSQEGRVPVSPGVEDFDVSGVPIFVDPTRLSEEDLGHMRKPGGILEYFGYRSDKPATEIDAWKRYALSIAAKTGDLLSNEISGVRNSTSLGDGLHNIKLDPRFFQKLEAKILELARRTGKPPVQILAETGITNPMEAWVAISSDVFRLRLVQPEAQPPSSGTTTPPSTGTRPPTEQQRPPARQSPAPTPSPTPRCSGDNVLPYERSGDISYPRNHSVFTNTVQNHGSDGNWPPLDLDHAKYLDGVRDDYRKSDYGSTFLQQLAYEITQGDANQSIERALVRAGKERFSIFTGQDPLYRLGEGSTIDKPQNDFEFLVIKGSPTGDRLFSFETEMIRRAVSDTYGNKCKRFQILDNPSKSDFEDAIKERAESARKNKRKLYIFYTGHGITTGGFQAGVTNRDQSLQGSRIFSFGLSSFFDIDENYYKGLLKKYLKDVETISIFDACYSGAAVTAIDPEELRRYFASLA